MQDRPPLLTLHLSEKMSLHRFIPHVSLTGLLTALFAVISLAQDCPSNIDFENGNFDGWTCYTGTAEKINDQNRINLSNSGGPVPGRHTMFSRNAGNDPYGGFPINCPNGSGYSIRLGNDEAGTQAEGI